MICQRRAAVITLSVAVSIAAACSKPAPPPPPAPVVAPPNQDSINLVRRQQMTADSIARAESMPPDRQKFADDSIAAAKAALAAASHDSEPIKATIAAPR